MPSRCEKYIAWKFLKKRFKKRAKPEFGNSVEVIERLHAAKINCSELGVVVQRFGEVAPVHSERVYR